LDLTSSINSNLKIMHISVKDAQLEAIITEAWHAQENKLTLIASENYLTTQALKFSQKVAFLSNKYAEGYPGQRYYGGCDHVDQIEKIAMERAKQLFGVEYANVQPHSGSQANAAVLMALLSPGDCFLGMQLAHGGHLTHGAKINFSGHFYTPIAYGVNEKGIIDYEQVAALAQQSRPKLIITGYSAYSRSIDWARFREIADAVGAYLMADISHIAGLVATGLHPSPVPFADVVTTTTHKTLRGPRGGMILAREASFAKLKKLNRAVFPGLQGGPLVHIIAAKAAALYEALQPEFKAYQQAIIRNAQTMAQAIQQRGFSIISDGTDNHLFLIDLSKQGVSGKEAAASLEMAHIITNKNMLPNDTKSATETSGLRLGTPAITTRGLRETEAQQLAHWIADILENTTDQEVIATVRTEVINLCKRFPVYDNL
jgi:glycine hydroxymethyltransferase